MKEISLVFLLVLILSTFAGPFSESTPKPPCTYTERKCSTDLSENMSLETIRNGKLSQEENQSLQDICGQFGTFPSGKKSFGSDYAQRTEAPWVVAVSLMRNRGDLALRCSATLISSRHVLAAKHCQWLDSISLQEFLFVFDNDCGANHIGFGRPNCSIKGAIIRKAVKAFYPEGNLTIQGVLDLMVFELDEPVPISKDLHPACLADSIPKSRDILQLFAFGWDGIFSKTKFGSLQKINVTVIPCLEDEKHMQGQDTFCVNSKRQQTLPGDSGGGFISTGEDDRRTVVGVVSGGWNITSNYMVYAETAVAPHLNWICEYIGICVDTDAAQFTGDISILHA